jgi:hypothetical protein
MASSLDGKSSFLELEYDVLKLSPKPKNIGI